MDAPSPSGVFLFGDFRFDRRGGGLFRISEDGMPSTVPLGSRAVDLLGVLLERHGDIVSKTEIMDLVWPGIVVEEANLAVQVSALRRALDRTRSGGSWIQTIAGRGYRFVAAVTRLSADSSAARSLVDASPGGQTPVSAAPPSAWRVGRAAPLRTLSGSLRRALAGERQMVFVTGEAGIGKTTLLDMFLTRVPSEDIGVLRGHCTELLGTGEAFLPLIEALQTACHGSDGPLLLDTMRTHAPTWLAQMPGFLDANDRAALQSEIFGATRERMLREFCELMEAASEVRPWIVVLEDLHWSDPATLDALSRFARRDRKAAVQVLATYRPVDGRIDGHPVLTVHQDLRVHQYCEEIAVDRLDDTDVERYLMLRFGNGRVARRLSKRILTRTAGHPLFVVSFVDDFVACGAVRPIDGQWHLEDEAALSEDNIPRNAREMLSRQIDRLDVVVQRLLEIASAAGPEFSAAVVARAIGGDVLLVERSFDLLARNGHILSAAGLSDWPDGTSAGRYAFQHALYQEVLYQRLPPGQLVVTHRRLGESLEAGYQARLAEIAPLLAMHFEAGRDFEKAIHYLAQAAENAAMRFATREAAQYLTRAMGLTNYLSGGGQSLTRINLLRQRGWVRRSAGDLAGSLDDLRTMISLAGESGQTRMEVTGLLDLSRFNLFADRADCLPAAERARNLSDGLDDDVLAALVHGSAASNNLHLKGWRDEDAASCRRAILVAAELRDPAILMRTAAIEGTLAMVAGDYQASRVAAARGKEIARRAGDVFMFVLHHVQESFALTNSGALGEVRSQTAAALAMTERNGNRAANVFCRLIMAWLHVQALDFVGAVTVCEQNYDSALEANPFVYVGRRIALAKARLGLHDYAAAWAHLADVEKSVTDNDVIDYPFRVELYHCLCEYWTAVGGWDEARYQAERLLALTALAPDRNYLALAHRLLARIAMAQNDMREARHHVSRAVSTLEDADLPLSARRIYLTAAAFHESVGESGIATAYRNRHERIVETLAATLEPGDPLRSSLQLQGPI